MKKISMIMLISLCMLLSACTPIFPEKVEVAGNYIKNNLESSFGNLAACYDDKIYYFSDESGVTGIYRMDFDGENVQMVIPCDDVKKLQLKDGKLYFLKWKEAMVDYPVITNIFTLMQQDLESGEEKELQLNPLEHSSYGPCDFYVGDQELIFNDLHFSSPVQKIYQVTGIRLTNGEFLKNINTYKAANVLYSEGGTLYLYDFGDILCIGDSRVGTEWAELRHGLYISTYSALGIFDKEECERVFDFHSGLDGEDDNPAILFRSKDTLFIAETNNLISYSLSEEKIISEHEISDMEALKNAVGNDEYLLIRGLDSSGRECIVSFSRESGEVHPIVTVDEKSRLVYLDLNNYVLLENTQLRQVMIDENAKEQNREIPIRVNLKKYHYETDVAGDWLFITHWDKKKHQRKLDYKINLREFQVSENIYVKAPGEE